MGNSALTRQFGLGFIGYLGCAAILIIVILASMVGFYEGRKAPWDSKVREMCMKDGGVRIMERVTLSNEDYKKLGGSQGMIKVPHERNASPDYPYANKGDTQILNEHNPRVYRSEDRYIRRSDGKVIAIAVGYSRVGGDFPAYAHPSSFACPDAKQAALDERKIFVVQ